MSYALNEVEATAKRAARGAGYSWGLAEEASKATRWLCAKGIDGSAVLAGLLEVLQFLTPDRIPNIIATLCSAAGALVGALLSELVIRTKTGLQE